MPRKSSIRTLDKEVRQLIDELIAHGGYTLDQIKQELRAKQPDKKHPSRAALGRYSQSVEKIGDRLRQSRAVASVWAEQLGKDPEGDIGKTVLELLRTLSFDATEDLVNSVGTLDDDGKPFKLDPKVLSTLALAMQRLEAAGKWSLEREKTLRAAVMAEAADRVEETAKAQGMDEQQARFWRERFMAGA